MTDEKLRVLILCTGNSCRSQMAEGFLRELGGGLVEAYSAGIQPTGLNPTAVAVMAEAGVDISDQTCDHIESFLNEQFDYIITVCDHAAANCLTFPAGGVRLHWPFNDPAGIQGSDSEIMREFRRVRDEIRTEVEDWIKTKI